MIFIISFLILIVIIESSILIYFYFLLKKNKKIYSEKLINALELINIELIILFKDFKFTPKHIEKTINAFILGINKLKMANELKHKNVTDIELINDIMHEIKTPVFIIQSYIEMLNNNKDFNEDIKLNFQKLLKNIERIYNLINQLNYLSKLNYENNNYSSFNIYNLISNLKDNFIPLTFKKNINIIINPVKNKNLFVFANEEKIITVLNNLILNAINYGKEGGKIIIKIEEINEKVFIEVEDDGIGISNEDQILIFNKFYRVDKSRSNQNGNSGLGLSIVKEILNHHNTFINVVSELGKGTKINFLLNKK